MNTVWYEIILMTLILLIQYSSEKISMLDYSKRNTRIFKLLNIILKPIYAVQKELVRIVQEG